MSVDYCLSWLRIGYQPVEFVNRTISYFRVNKAISLWNWLDFVCWWRRNTDSAVVFMIICETTMCSCWHYSGSSHMSSSSSWSLCSPVISRAHPRTWCRQEYTRICPCVKCVLKFGVYWVVVCDVEIWQRWCLERETAACVTWGWQCCGLQVTEIIRVESCIEWCK